MRLVVDVRDQRNQVLYQCVVYLSLEIATFSLGYVRGYESGVSGVGFDFRPQPARNEAARIKLNRLFIAFFWKNGG
jgi:hypothetical protein